ncbi:MAG: hypothetical protein H6533_10750 [Thermoleophilales bacterium]|nr:hypothetical protein [Thermoleophilales bacterium]
MSEAGRLVIQPPRDAVPAVVAGCALATAVAVAVLIGGGFSAGSRSAFAGLAGLSLLLAAWAAPPVAAAAARSLPVAALTALAALTACSAIWSPAEPAEVLRWSMVIAGYAAVAVAAAAAARRGTTGIAVFLAGLITLCGLWGLLAAAAGDAPAAARIGGSWRPAGPFEYPPALAIASVSMLPALQLWMTRARAMPAALAAIAAATAGAVLGLAHSRLALALMVVFMISFVVGASGGERRLRLAATLLVCAAAVASFAIAGGLRGGGPQGSGYALGLGAVIILAAVAWTPIRARWPVPTEPEERSPRLPRPTRVRVLATVAILGVAGIAGLAFAPDRSGAGIQPSSGVDHGRIGEWRAAVDIGESEPLLGAGAESYGLVAASEGARSATLYAHSLPLESFAELGVTGLLLSLLVLAGTALAAWCARDTDAGVLLGPAAIAFAAASLVDWSWHLAGSGAIWAVALGALIAAVQGRPT